nr:RNA-directed DNA polymerase, eukaryota [Tanacetum cinerariifolium]
MDQEDDINKVSLEIAVSWDLSWPSGFEHMKRTSKSKMTRLETFRLKSMWGNYNFNVACSMARGRSGGMISMWDSNSFIKDDIWYDDIFIIVKGHWRNTVGDCYMINIYGPQDSLAKAILWNTIGDFMHQHADNYGFIDLPLGSRLFTWMNKAGTELSKLDRFLISEEVAEALPDVRVTVIDQEKIKAGSANDDDHDSRIKLIQEVDILVSQIKNVVWDCGSSKAPGPDGFSFAFVTKY